MNLIFNEVHTLGIEILKNKLNAAGFHTKIIQQSFRDAIKEFNPKIIYLTWTFNHPIRNLILELPEIKKDHPNLKVVIGSYSATFDWEYLQEIKEIDAIIGGYADDVIVPCTIDVLNNIECKLKYLKNPPVDLSIYDYENNIFVEESTRIIVCESTRSCPRILTNPCSYCNQYKEEYRKLDLNEIIRVLRKKSSQYDRIIINDPEVPPNVINTIWEEFSKPIGCFTEAAYLLHIKETKNCFYQIGFDYPGEINPYNPKKNITPEILTAIKKLSRYNHINCYQVYLKDESELPLELMKKLANRYPNLQLASFPLTPFPGVFGKKSPENIYKKDYKFKELSEHSYIVFSDGFEIKDSDPLTLQGYYFDGTIEDC